MKKKGSNHFMLIARFAICGLLLQFIFLSQTFASLPGTEDKSLTQEVKQDNIKVSGKVTSEEAPQGVPGVNVVIQGTTQGTITDINGNYSIEVPSSESVLVFSSVGYITEVINVAARSVIDVFMVPDLQALEEVVVIGYGSQTKRDITGSVQTVSFDDMSEVPVGQIAQKLQGKLAGVQINQFTGMPGQGMNIRVRGQLSISAGSDPLYVVDGLPLAGNIDHLNPNEIESLTVLKDAASTSLYGSRAANGVILINTKSAKVGKTSINLNAYYGVQQVPQRGRPEMMNAREFATFKQESYTEKGLPVPEAFQNPAQYGEGTNWYDLLLRDAPVQDYSLSISSGSEKSSVSVIAGYFKQDGVMLNSGYERFSVRVNTSFNLTKWLKTGFNIAPTHGIRNQLDTDGLFYNSGGRLLANALLAWPIIDYKNADGTISPTAYIEGVSSFRSPNWYYTIQHTTDKVSSTKMLSNYYIEASIIDGLTVKSTFNADLGYIKSFEFRPSYISHSWTNPPPRPATAQLDNELYYSLLNENTITYTKSLGDHNLVLLGGITEQVFRMENTEIDASVFTDDRTPAIESATTKVVADDIQEWSLLSYLARLNYNYKGKYLFTAAIRRDGSSRFGTDNKWGNFPSVSAGWIVSDEEFMAGTSSYISFLKLRASYGVTGNNSIGNYRHLPTLSTASVAIFGTNIAGGAAPNSIGNIDLGWETTKQADLGVDIGLFRGRVQFMYDYYQKLTTNLLFSVNVPQASGFQNIWDNVGEIKFWGHDFALNTKNLIGTFRWNTDFIISFSKNEVMELSGLTDRVYGDRQVPGGGDRLGSTVTLVGKPIGQFYGLVQDGVYETQDEFDNSPKHIQSQLGGIKFVDVNGDGVITLGGDNDDRDIIGNPFPKAVIGMTNEFYYGNFDLSITISGAYGHDVARMSDIGATNLDGVFNVLKDVEGRWRSEADPGDGKYGRVSGVTSAERDWFHSRFIHDGDYINIRNITLGYNIPLSQNVFKSARVYASIYNAHIFTKYDGMNPEVSTQQNGNEATDINYGFDFGAYPVPRTISFGVNMNF
ncbi:MAG: TonB-dependent receptor [Bacteroidales bacterium]